ncbi:CrcB family protein [Bacillus luteolus]|uniref:Fluoride-specific ion channel FluC n=1 Tax=Litchfieldia luteola TaxID=682179 RepID=A0ABR9QE99_9BACI|nr:CrcB family protein [Cytobacillus luteolus]MBE4906816.1 CrcB family protein [Cytobacillus luteolus]MBP1940530.1 CrcB protein [Cytobacillus luteolus]
MIILIGLGGSFGALCRYIIALRVTNKSNQVFPLATFIINSSGSFLLGVLGALYMSDLLAEWVWYLVGIGFMGAYTTFSTFGVEAIQLLLQGNRKIASYYVLLSVLLGITGAGVGFISTTYFL